MPKVDGLDKSIRVAMLKDEISDDAEPVDLPPPVTSSVTPAPVAAAPSAAPPFDMAAFAAILASAMNQSGVTQADAIKAALADATTMAREPIPENKVHPGISVYSHPLGDQAHPRTPLRCPMYLGVYDDDGAITPAFQIFEDTCTEDERLLLNAVTPGRYLVERNDNQVAQWLVAEKLDGLGQPMRLVIAVPFTWLHKDQFQQMPSQTRFLQQLTA